MLETIFIEEDIEDIYKNIIMYSVLKYGRLDARGRDFFRQKYEYALSCFPRCKVDFNSLKYETLEKLESCLRNYQVIYYDLLKHNQKIIDELGPKIEWMIVSKMRKMSELEQLSFLFDFFSCFITYSEDYFDFCLQAPFVSEFVFDFKENVPVDSSINGMLVMGQGCCDDIANLMVYFGKKLHLNIGTSFATYQGNQHSLNTVTLNNHLYLMDVTRKIRGEFRKEQCFLVSIDTLKKMNDYQFHNSLNATDYLETLPNLRKDVDELLEILEEIRPKVMVLGKDKKI